MSDTANILALERVAEAAEDLLTQFDHVCRESSSVYHEDVADEIYSLRIALQDAKPLDNPDVL